MAAARAQAVWWFAPRLELPGRRRGAVVEVVAGVTVEFGRAVVIPEVATAVGGGSASSAEAVNGRAFMLRASSVQAAFSLVTVVKVLAAVLQSSRRPAVVNAAGGRR